MENSSSKICVSCSESKCKNLHKEDTSLNLTNVLTKRGDWREGIKKGVSRKIKRFLNSKEVKIIRKKAMRAIKEGNRRSRFE